MGRREERGREKKKKGVRGLKKSSICFFGKRGETNVLVYKYPTLLNKLSLDAYRVHQPELGPVRGNAHQFPSPPRKDKRKKNTNFRLKHR